jgi:hypothetical protein
MDRERLRPAVELIITNAPVTEPVMVCDGDAENLAFKTPLLSDYKALLESKGWTAEDMPCCHPNMDAWVVRIRWAAVTMYAYGGSELEAWQQAVKLAGAA